MQALIAKSEVHGTVSAPSSKSYTIRALMCAALTPGKSEIIQPLSSEDTEAAFHVLSQVGVDIGQDKDAWRINGGNFRQPDTVLFCGNSAATLRFMTAICALIPGKCQLVPGPSLAKRPIKPLLQALEQLGVSCSQDESAAVTVAGGRLKGGTAQLPGDISSQYVSALLLIAPAAEAGVNIRLTTPLESKPYVLMTMECQRRFGIRVRYSRDLRQFAISPQTYRPTRYNVEGDWSSASYLLALGALSGEVEVQNLNPKSLQGDRMLLNWLKEMGARVELTGNSIIIRQSRLSAIRADLSDGIDLLPTMAVLAATASGTSEFTGIARARIKESNRVTAIKEGLKRMGIKVTEEKNRITIAGAMPHGAIIDSQDDHRIAMAFGILGTVAGNTIINSAECVAKTYPEFWEVVKSIGGKVAMNGQ